MSALTIEDMNDEINTETLDQLTDLKLMISRIQSSIPKDRVTLEYFISNELSNVIKALHQHSSTTKMAILQDTLLKELSSHHHNSLEDITAKLENEFQKIHERLEEVQTYQPKETFRKPKETDLILEEKIIIHFGLSSLPPASEYFQEEEQEQREQEGKEDEVVEENWSSLEEKQEYNAYRSKENNKQKNKDDEEDEEDEEEE